MKMASTAADAAVDAPKISRNSRSQPIWYTRAQKPDPKSRNPAVQVRPPTALGATPGSASGRGRIREKLSARKRVKYNLRAGSAQRVRIRDEEEADGHAAARSIEERASPDTVDAVLFEDWIG